MLNGLDLFSGIGGITMALGQYVKPAAYCEIDKYAQSVLLSRMSEGRLPVAPIWDDISTLEGKNIPSIDIIYGGFPCQDLSTAGLGKGLEGQRSGLFFQILRLAKEIKPQFIFLENVPAIRTRGLDRVGRELAEAGYDCRWCVISAASIGANHKRERWFLLGYAQHHGQPLLEESRSNESTIPDSAERQNKAQQSKGTSSSGVLARESTEKPSRNVADACGQARREKTEGWPKHQQAGNQLRTIPFSSGPKMADPKSKRCEPGGQSMRAAPKFSSTELHGEFNSNANGTRCKEFNPANQPDKQGFYSGHTSAEWGASWWAIEPCVGRVANGIPKRVDIIKCLGNGVVPLQVKTTFEMLMGMAEQGLFIGDMIDS